MNDDEKLIKYLEFIESNIAKMNTCSFRMKEWAIAILTAILTLYVSSINHETGSGNKVLIIVAIVPTIILWILDSYYLKEDRRFRALYNDVLDGKIAKMFAMSRKEYKGFKYSTFKMMFTKTEWPIYLLTIIGLFVGYIFL